MQTQEILSNKYWCVSPIATWCLCCLFRK